MNQLTSPLFTKSPQDSGYRFAHEIIMYVGQSPELICPKYGRKSGTIWVRPDVTQDAYLPQPNGADRHFNVVLVSDGTAWLLTENGIQTLMSASMLSAKGNKTEIF
ncbi:MAG: hypothetical protein JNM99_09585 [Verrucomicrobiaceae bacterium]|nr:hypothetical protein [Verrucomicrobiaceae bacterium]